MKQYIDKAALAANVEARYNECLQRAKIIDAEYWNGKADAYRNMLVVLDTLEVQEVDLEKEIKEEYLKRRYYGGRDNMLVILNEPQFYKIAKHFIELGLISQLSWQDVKKLFEINVEFMASSKSNELSEEEYYTEILKNFKKS